ncbi:MAG: peptidyl-prolyl cis-trans isomerase [Polyangiaceae bacterium]|nr:peptidyl-prolyl cis-trans isomerase [Polyangiaceae bacterium]
MTRATALSTLLTAALAASLSSCNEPALEQPTDGGTPAFGLTAEQSSRVLARIGDRRITLGDFGRTLERMDQFDRLRYQTKERRRELLGELVDVELLAQEARRRGLDKDPEVEDAIRQLLRDAMLAKARQGLPAPAEISAEEVRAYYEANADRFDEPERRRVAAIVMTDRKAAEKVLKEAEKSSTGSAWGELFYKHSITAPKERGPNSPVDLAGDLGIVGPPGDVRGGNPQVPEPIRAAVFKIGDVGAIAGEVVEVEGKLYIVRMNGITAGHKRTLAEADRSIRVAILQQKMANQDRALEAELRKKLPVQIDEAALGAIKLPEQLTAPGSGASPRASQPSPQGAEPAPAPDGGPAQAGDGGP